MSGQITQVVDNLETVLKEAGSGLEEVVRLTCYTTDMAATLESLDTLIQRLNEADCKTSMTLPGVTALFHPEIMIEIEAKVIQ